MRCKDVGGLGEEDSLADVDLLFAGFAFVVTDGLTFYELLKGSTDGSDVFDCQGQVVEVLNTILAGAALKADYLGAGLPTEERLEEILPGSSSKHVLDAVEGHAQKLLGILLLPGVSRFALKILEGEAELDRVVVSSLAEFQVCHQLLHLMNHVIIDFLSLLVSQLLGDAILDREEVVAEGWDHEELLHHRVHVANTT
jgi:hypothetical protein